MSKIGRVNLELQEQANELGYDTVQEALDNGYVVGTDVFGGTTRLIKPIDMQKELEKAATLTKKDKSKEARKEKLKKEIETNLRAEGYPIRLDGLKHYDTLMEKLWLPDSELEEAHEAWLKEKEEVLEGLNGVAEYFEAMGYPDNYVPTKHGKTIRHAIEFIKKGEV